MLFASTEVAGVFDLKVATEDALLALELVTTVSSLGGSLLVEEVSGVKTTDGDVVGFFKAKEKACNFGGLVEADAGLS